jgi:hypothetical protein
MEVAYLNVVYYFFGGGKMKYIGAITMILVGILIIGLAATIPGFSIINITQTNSTVSYNQISSYPSSTSLNDPTVFPFMAYATLSVTFSTGYDFSSVLSAYATGTITIIDYNASSAIVSNYVTTWSVQIQKQIGGIQPTTQTNSYAITYYRIVATSKYVFNNPVQGGQHVYQISWTSKLTFDAIIIGTNSIVNKTISATGTTVYGTFPVTNAYPGYIVVYNCTSSWDQLGDPYGPYTSLSFNTSQINIQVPESQSYAYLDFIYVEYNRWGNTLWGFVEAYLEFPWTAGNKQWIFNNANTTTYNGYPALYLHVKLSPGKYLINGYVLYNFSQYNKIENVLIMSVTWNITSPSMFLLNLNIEQVISYLIGTILIFVGAVDAWRWRI